MSKKLIILMLLFSKCLYSMEEEIKTPKSLLLLASKKVAQCLEYNKLKIDTLNLVPFAINTIVNIPYKEANTLPHVFAEQIKKNNTENKSISIPLKKLQYLIYNKFISDVNTQGNFGNTLLHILAQVQNSETIKLMFDLIHIHGACVRIPDRLCYNVMENAIYARNEAAVTMLLETTNSICNIERYFSGVCFVTMIENEAKREADGLAGKRRLFTYLKDKLPRFKQLYDNQHVLAPCCAQGGHKMYYDHTMM